MPRPYKVLSTVHTGITVASLPKATAFWTDVLGFELVSEGSLPPGDFIDNLVGVTGAALRYAVVAAPGHRIELLEYHSPADRTVAKPRSCDVGSVHIAFSVDGLDAVLARAGEHGWHAVGDVQTVKSGPKTGTRAIYVRSEDGVTIELQEPPTLSN
ncbi:MAG: VOC family protein [Myxococcota bacterium]|jgi:catechol 2,3-dioxygenase-like lactoylglutathione lyase family enzyme